MFCKIKNIFKNMSTQSKEISMINENKAKSIDYNAFFIKIDCYSDLNLTGLC